MKILRKDTDLNILLNTETDFQTNLGWEENLKEFERLIRIASRFAEDFSP